jgi:murein DD-endopeptidase MepM/ murein hydrolase activator NlpD
MPVRFGPAAFTLAGAERGSYSGYPVSGQITDTFGTHAQWRKDAGLGPHSGVDIAATAGTEIRAPAEGEVVTNAFHDQLGNYLTLRHEDDTYTGYAHMVTPSPLAVSQRVERGQVIGWVGETGAAFGAHLHWMHTQPGNRHLRVSAGLSDPLASVDGFDPAHPEPVEGPEPVEPQPVEGPEPVEGPRSYTIDLILPDGAVATLDVDEYVKGVVPREMATGWPMEALKAQAVAAKSYAIANRRVFTTTRSQVWSPQHFPDTDEAVEQVRGIYLASNGEIVSSFYFAHCPQRTRTPSQAGWASFADRPYLQPVDCPCGRTTYFGHGIGMCQRGAEAMAKQGARFDEILRHYYTGIELIGLDSSPPPPPPANAQTYTVQPGDTLRKIASRFGTTVNAILSLNRDTISDPNRIAVGQVITLPRGAVEEGATEYIVQPGDTLSKLARQWGTDVATLVALNSLANPSLLSIGQRLRRPS